MPYGENIPSRLYRNRTPMAASRYQMFQEIHKGLIAVGMRPIVAQNTTHNSWYGNWTTVAWERYDHTMETAGMSFSHGAYRVHYDFPTSETFTIDGVEWRPFLQMMTGSASAATTETNRTGHCLFIRPGIRKASDPSVLHPTSDTYTWHRIGLANGAAGDPHYFPPDGGGSESIGWTAYRNPIIGHEGLTWWDAQAKAGLYDESSADVSDPHWRTIPLNNLEVVLTKAGLTVALGTGASKNDSSSGGAICFSCLFIDRRIPGRARAPVQDTELGKVCPMAYVTWHSPGYAISTVYDSPTNRGGTQQAVLFGATYQDRITGIRRWTPSYVCARFATLYMRDRAYSPNNDLLVADSPQPISTESSSHVLSPLVFFLGRGGEEYAEQWSGSTELYSSTLPAYSTTNPVPRWDESWYTPFFCATDPVAPYGIRTDPTSGDKWYIFYSTFHGTMVAHWLGPAPTIISAFTQPAHTLATTTITADANDLTAASGTPVSVIARNAAWTMAGGVVTGVMTTSTNLDLTIEFDTSAFPANTRFFEFEAEMRFRGSTVATNRKTADTTFKVGDSILIYAVTAAGNEITTMTRFPCAGIDDADPFYTYRVYRFPVFQNPNNDNKVRVMFRLERRLTSVSELRTFEMRNLKFRVITPNYGS